METLEGGVIAQSLQGGFNRNAMRFAKGKVGIEGGSVCHCGGMVNGHTE